MKQKFIWVAAGAVAVIVVASLMAVRGKGENLVEVETAVIERETGINDFLEVGVELDAKPSATLLHSIFHHASPLHDGAVIIQRGRITRAGCFLPLTQDPGVSPQFGTRHRAAIGLTELVDAVVIVVSEETGRISVVIGGKITRDLEVTTLKKVLNRLLEPRRLRGKKN